MAATCGLFLLHTSSSVTSGLAYSSDLFFDFSSKIRAGSTATSTVGDDGESRPKIDSEVAEADLADTTPANFGHTSSSKGEEVDVSEEVAEALAEIEDLLQKLVAETIVTTENLLGLSVQVPANATAAEWVSAYGDMMSNEQEGYYNAEASGYIT